MRRNAGDYVKSWGAALIRGAASNPEFTVIYVKYITYEGLLHNTLALDVDTVQEACIQQTRV